MSGVPTRPLLRAYVDETGDRGTSGSSSPFFSFAAVLVADEDEAPLRAAVSKLRRDLKVPAGRALHWNEHVKTFSRRQHVAATLVSVPRVVTQFVVVEKAAIPASAGMRSDHAIFYNFAAGLVLERVLLAGRDWEGGARDCVVRFGHVRGFDHTGTTEYFRLKRSVGRGAGWVPWHLLGSTPTFEGQASWDGLQAADQYAGMLHAALRRDEFGNYEPHHFLSCRRQVRRSSAGRAWAYGFKILGNDATFQSLPWWPDAGL